MDSEQSPPGHGWLRLSRFTVAPGPESRLTLTLEGELRSARRPPKDVQLLARRAEKITVHRPAHTSVERLPGSPGRFRRGQRLNWQVGFQVPIAVGEDPRTTYELLCEPHAPLDLPALGFSAGHFPALEPRTPRVGVAVLASAAALLAGLAPGFALADGTSGTAATSGSTTSVTATTSTGESSTTTTTTSTQTTTSTSSTPSTTTSTTPTVTATAPASSGTTTKPKPTAPKPAKHKPGGHRSTTTGSHGHHHPSKHKADHKPKQKSKHKSKAKHHGSAAHHPRHRSGGAAITPKHHAKPRPRDEDVDTATPVVSSGNTWTLPAMADPFTSAQLRQYAALVGGLDQPPKYLVKIYRAAAHHYRLPWQVLAAINYVETRYGQDLAVSPAGAIGWMQFMPATWSQYGQSVNLKGKPAPGMPDPWQPTDAIFAAARYLTAAGAQRNLPRAVYAYNHAGWYVQEVLSIAEQITRRGLHPKSKARRKLLAMTTMAHLLNGLPYVWGGGHATFSLVSSGYDCSGFVSAVLHAAGYLQVPVNTQSLPGQPRIKYGPGRWVTIFDRTDAGISDDHVIIEIEGQWWESGGWGVLSDRVHRIHHMQAAYLQSFNLVLHPQGL